MVDGRAGEPLEATGTRGGPTVLRILVGAQLKRLREAAGVSRQDAAESIRGSEAKMSRLEAGRVGFKKRDVADLLGLYGVTDAAECDAVVERAMKANEPGWWSAYNDLMPDWFSTYVGMEQAARIIRSYEAQYVPGLLQTEAYASAVIDLGQAVRADEIAQRVELRMQRQQLLFGSDPPDYWALVDEAVVRRTFGGRQIMREQLGHMLEVSKRPNITIQVVPFDRSDAAPVGGPFTLLRFSESDMVDIVYLEQLNSANYEQREAEVESYLKVVDRLAAGALTPRRSADLIDAIRTTL